MAVVVTALTFVADYVPYERPPQPQTLWSAIPRGLFTGIVNAGTLDLKPVNDQQQLTITMTLPPNFGYVMSDCQLEIFQNRAASWNSRCQVQLTNFIRGAAGNVQGLTASYPQNMQDTTGVAASKAMQVLAPWPTMPIVASEPGAPTIVLLEARNNDATAATAGSVMAFASFWQFDLEQIRKYPINSPQPVHAR